MSVLEVPRINSQNEMYDLAAAAWGELELLRHITYDESGEGKTFVVNGSMPILYFGDVNQYQSSDLRIVTAALNPSDKEFPMHDGHKYKRFPLMLHNHTSEGGTPGFEYYFHSLNDYFNEDPYRRWFGTVDNEKSGTFEPVLVGMDASYWGSAKGKDSTAIHTDVITPIATSPTCSGLRGKKITKSNKSVVDVLSSSGGPMWLKLMAVLKPHIVLLAISRSDFKYIRIPSVDEWSNVIYRKPNSFQEVRAAKVEFSEGFPTLLVCSKMGNMTPFMNFGEYKYEVGRAVLDFYHNGFKTLPAYHI